MPPKSKGQKNEPSKKAVQKQKDKIIEDKTFGLKNKKGKKQQQFVKMVNQQVKYGGTPSSRKSAQDVAEKQKKSELKKKEQEELNMLFKPVVTQKVSAGTDPKSVLCMFFKQGLCTKGDKCKFSHDPSVERKSEKINIYVDARDGELENDTMDKWDQEKLEEVVNKKHGEKEKCQTNKTEIVCKHFLEAIEKGLYGWFWVCPNGGAKCMYRHALPPGFVLKKKEDKDKKEEISMEEFVESERAKLGGNLTKVTLETFLAWKKRKLKEKEDQLAKEMAKKKEDFKTGRVVGKVSGREVFQFKPELMDDEDDEGEESVDLREFRTADDQERLVEITVDSFSQFAQNLTGPGTVASSLSAADRLEGKSAPCESLETTDVRTADVSHVDQNGLEEACAAPAVDDGAAEVDPDSLIDGVPIDENLFDDDDLDLDELDIND